MKAISVIVAVCCAAGIALAAEEPAPSKAPSPKLAAMLDAKDKDGKPIITAEQRAYYDGLDDRLKDLLGQVVEKDVVTRAEHLGVLLALGLRPQKMEVLLQNNCVLCHSDSEVQAPTDLFSLATDSGPPTGHMNLKELVEDVHFKPGLSCAGCHGGDPSAQMGHEFVKEWPESGRDKNRAWVAQFCARCHSDPTFMHQYNASLPTDQLAKFKESPHGQLLLEKHDDRAPECVSCHGVHGIRAAKDPKSKVYRQRVPQTCGACHSDSTRMAGFQRADGSPLPTTQLAEYRRSVHGRALLERGDMGAPACNTCHGNHAAIPPGVATVSRSCSLCHSANASLFDGSKHKQAFDQHNWAECSKCHGNHTIAKTSDAMLASGPNALCNDCHNHFANGNKECNATAKFFHDTVTQLDEARSRVAADTERLATKGLDVEPIANNLTELTDSLKKSRTYIHSFSRNTFQPVALSGQEAAAKADSLVKKAREEYKYRQIGLAVSIGLIGLLMAAIYLKLRQLER